MMRFLKNKKGFTLIELLIVMAILAILIGVSLPRFRGMQDEGVKSKARSGLATLRTAVEAYAASPRLTGISKYPDGADGTAQGAYTGVRTEGATGWQSLHLLAKRSASLTTGTTGPVMLSAELLDPFSPSTGNVEYGYIVNAAGYYVIWSNGISRDNTLACSVTAAGVVTVGADADGNEVIFVTNGKDASGRQSN